MSEVIKAVELPNAILAHNYSFEFEGMDKEVNWPVAYYSFSYPNSLYIQFNPTKTALPEILALEGKKVNVTFTIYDSNSTDIVFSKVYNLMATKVDFNGSSNGNNTPLTINVEFEATSDIGETHA